MAFIRKGVTGEALGFAGGFEADKGKGHDGEVYQLGCRHLDRIQRFTQFLLLSRGSGGLRG